MPSISKLQQRPVLNVKHRKLGGLRQNIRAFRNGRRDKAHQDLQLRQHPSEAFRGSLPTLRDDPQRQDLVRLVEPLFPPPARLLGLRGLRDSVGRRGGLTSALLPGAREAMLGRELLRRRPASHRIRVGRLQSEDLVDQFGLLVALHRRQVECLLCCFQARFQVSCAIRYG